MAIPLAESVLGFLLVFLLPGFAISKAVFPEKRVKGPGGALWLVELVTLSLFLSVVLTILLGFVLLTSSPGGFTASWSDPVLQAGLAVIVVLGLVVGVLRGAYGSTPPPAPSLEPSPGSNDGWEILRQLETGRRDERRLTHALRRKGLSQAEEALVQDELTQVRSEIRRIRQDREAEYAR